MSIQAMTWALEQQMVTNPSLRLLLLCLANYASATGRNVFPSVDTLTMDTGLSESTIRRGLDKLEEMGLIVRGNQAAAVGEISRADRRPVVYDLPIPRPERGITDTPRDLGGVSPTSQRGVTGVETGCQGDTQSSPRSVREPQSARARGDEERARALEDRWAKLRALARENGFREPNDIERTTPDAYETLLRAHLRSKPYSDIKGDAAAREAFRQEFRARFGSDPA